MSRFSTKPKWFRLSTYLVLIYLTYALLIGVVTPAVLKAKLPNIVKENTGRDAAVEDIAINPFLLKIEVTNFVIYPNIHSSNESEDNAVIQNQENHFFSVGNVSLDVGFWQSLFTFTPAVESLTIDEPFVSIARLSESEDTQIFNFSDILTHVEKRSTKAPEEPNDTSEGQIPRITLRDFALNEGRVVIEDKVTNTLLDYPELSVDLQDLDTHALISSSSVGNKNANPKSDKSESAQSKGKLAFNQYQFNLLTAEKGNIAIDGEFQLSPLKVTTDITINDVALTPLWSLSKDLIEADLVDGKVNLSLHAEVFEQDTAFQFILERGEFGVNNLVFNADPSPATTGTAKSSQEIIAIPAFAIHDINVNALEQQVSIAEVAFDNVRVSGLFDKSGLDLQRLFTPKSPAADATSANANPSAAQEGNSETEDEDVSNVATDSANELAHETSWYVELHQFAFNDGSIDLLERSVSDGTYYRISNLNIKSGKVTTDFSKPISYTTSLHVSANPQTFSDAPNGVLSSSGQIVIAEQTIKGKAAIEQLVLSHFQQYVSPHANVTLEEGLFNLNVEFDGAFMNAADKENIDSLNVKASTSINNLSVLDDDSSPLLQWQSLNVDNIEFDHASNQLSVDNIHLQAPFARLIIDEAKQTNVSKLIVASSDKSANSESASENGSATTSKASNANVHASTTAEPSQANELAIAVNTISIENGKAYFADHSLTPKFASAIESLNGRVLGIDSRSTSPANVDITGKIDNYAPVKLAGTIHPLKDDIDLDLDFSVKGAELTSVNPYSGTYMGYYIDKGLLSLAVQYKLNGKALEGKNHVVIDQLTLGKKSNSDQALSLPLGLAIALLEDRNGVIDLGLDVSGDIDSPDFSFGSIILNAIGNIITKAVTAPFSLLANLVGSDDELDNVEFGFGEHSLNADAQEKLNTLAKALKKRPGLRVNIEGTVNAMSDASALAQRQLNTTLLTRSGDADASATSGNASTNENSLAGGENESSNTPGSVQRDSISGSNIPLEGPLADALLSYYVEVFTPDLNQEYDNMVAQLYPELANSDNEQSQKSADNNKEVINEESVNRALSIARYNKLRNNIDIPESDLILLADARSKAVKGYLANEAEVEANRLFLLNTQHDLHTEFSGVELTLEAK
ncbi:MAG: DUF748 domain-containing protein [Alteromonas macleodii]|uniref:DUF748 domain-containing protein n=1 Tax=Alteromonas TaxID=226 RepID=UPI001E57231B|nr:DUF748 domain-containing protein [Alteromonas macleodii]MDM7963330.1 DUF748 domain-containing protein [Alteromonas macleodii]MDM8171817.1 DUF748 domain-containing protein [Alteromonas macleodii]